MAELISLPAYEQLRVLHEQKYPKKQPQTFMAPFYLPAIAAIREYYRKERNPAVLVAAKQDLSHLGLKARRENNLRVLASFEKGDQAQRLITPGTNPRLEAAIGSLQLKLSADLRGVEKSAPRITFYNCRAASVEPEIARSALEIAQWVLAQNAVDAPPNALEFVDLFNGKVHKLPKSNPNTSKMLKKNVHVIEALWNSIISPEAQNLRA
jgi:hypothetical protein